jgi:hypothetical protein
MSNAVPISDSRVPPEVLHVSISLPISDARDT